MGHANEPRKLCYLAPQLALAQAQIEKAINLGESSVTVQLGGQLVDVPQGMAADVLTVTLRIEAVRHYNSIVFHVVDDQDLVVGMVPPLAILPDPHHQQYPLELWMLPGAGTGKGDRPTGMAVPRDQPVKYWPTEDS